MKLARLGPEGQETPVVVTDHGTYDLSGVVYDLTGEFFASGGLDRVRDALAADELPLFPAEGVRVGAPVARPSAVICIGMNYAAHAAESGAAPPERPILFLKHPGTVVGPHDDVLVPPGAVKVDWEVELAVVLGRRARYLRSEEEALACIAGFAVSNDVSERDYQLAESGGQWSKGKCCETFNPLGPWLVPVQDLPAGPQELGLRSWVNGEARQDSTTADMVFSAAALVLDLSRYLVLEPGDVVNTGTPEGVALSGRFPYLRDGDVVEVEVDGLGRQRSRVRDAEVPA